jgi:L-lactate dehydrogenase complex protein LldF
VKIDLHQQLFVMRRHLAVRRLVAPIKRIGATAAAFVLKRPRLYRAVGGAARTFLRIAPRWLIYHCWNPWGRQRELPVPPRESFRQRFRQR